MDKLSPGELRLIGLQLPIYKIRDYCKISKKFRDAVCNNKSFWQATFLKKFGPNTEIKEDSIKWYKTQVLKPELIQLKCENNQLIGLPDLPQIRPLRCENNQLTRLPEM